MGALKGTSDEHRRQVLDQEHEDVVRTWYQKYGREAMDLCQDLVHHGVLRRVRRSERLERLDERESGFSMGEHYEASVGDFIEQGRTPAGAATMEDLLKALQMARQRLEHWTFPAN